MELDFSPAALEQAELCELMNFVQEPRTTEEVKKEYPRVHLAGLRQQSLMYLFFFFLLLSGRVVSLFPLLASFVLVCVCVCMQ